MPSQHTSWHYISLYLESDQIISQWAHSHDTKVQLWYIRLQYLNISLNSLNLHCTFSRNAFFFFLHFVVTFDKCMTHAKLMSQVWNMMSKFCLCSTVDHQDIKLDVTTIWQMRSFQLKRVFCFGSICSVIHIICVSHGDYPQLEKYEKCLNYIITLYDFFAYIFSFYPACALRALGLLLADGVPTVGWGKTFWRVRQVPLTKTGVTRKGKVAK